MRHTPALLLPLLFACVAQEDLAPTRTSLDLLLGSRAFDEDFYEPLDEHDSVGFAFAIEDPRSGHGFEAGLLASDEEATVSIASVDMAVVELWAGYRHTFGGSDARWRPFIGAGPTFLVGEVSGSIAGLGSAEVTDSALGLYAQAGVRFPITGFLQLGATLRAVFGTDVEEQGIEADLDYEALLFSVGVGF
jgi:hypothetical protein